MAKALHACPVVRRKSPSGYECMVDEDLIAALQSGQVAAAGLDGYEGEPELHPGYLSLNNIFPLPHIGAATIATRTALSMLAWDNSAAVLNKIPASFSLSATTCGRGALRENC
jgi:lactate dehydrogenase-like 2-hydroxyacid dehydrogenase